MAEYIMNLIKSPESSSDWHLKNIVKSPVSLPKKISLEHLCGPIRDQGSAGFCHAFAGCALKNIQEHIEMNMQYDCSPLYLAKYTKENDNNPETEGATVIDVFKTLQKYGTVLESQYIYNQYNPGSLSFPDVPNENNLHKYKIKNYSRCDDLEDIKTALSMNKPVVLGVSAGNNFYALNNNAGKFLEPPYGMRLLGHAVVAVGYDDDLTWGRYKGFLRIQNSWGTSWGDNGFAWMPYEYITFKTIDTGIGFLIDAFCSIDLENDPNINIDTIELYLDKDYAFVNGERKELDAPAVIMNNRTMVPVRFIAEALNCNVIWDPVNRKVTINRLN